MTFAPAFVVFRLSWFTSLDLYFLGQHSELEKGSIRSASSPVHFHLDLHHELLWPHVGHVVLADGVGVNRFWPHLIWLKPVPDSGRAAIWIEISQTDFKQLLVGNEWNEVTFYIMFLLLWDKVNFSKKNSHEYEYSRYRTEQIITACDSISSCVVVLLPRQRLHGGRRAHNHEQELRRVHQGAIR